MRASIFSSDSVSPRRPFTCAQPVMPGLHLVAQHVALDELAVQLVVRHRVRARADDAHASLQHVDELRQLVERGAAQERAERRDARVVACAPAGSPSPSSVTRHGAELVDHDLLAVEAVAALPEDHRPGRAELHAEREQQRAGARSAPGSASASTMSLARLSRPFVPRNGVSHTPSTGMPLTESTRPWIRSVTNMSGTKYTEAVVSCSASSSACDARLRRPSAARDRRGRCGCACTSSRQLLDAPEHGVSSRPRSSRVVRAVVDEADHADVGVEVLRSAAARARGRGCSCRRAARASGAPCERAQRGTASAQREVRARPGSTARPTPR